MIIYIILMFDQVIFAEWIVDINYSSLCSCSQITNDQLCRQCQFCQLDLDYQCTEILDYNCSYFNEQTVQYLCSQLDRCYLNNQTCTELKSCSDLQGQSDEDCYKQSNRCGTVSQLNNTCLLTQCQSYQNQLDCNDSLMNIRFDNIGYGEVCYWNELTSSCQSLSCENVSTDLCPQYNNLCVVVNNLCTWATCQNLSNNQCTYVWTSASRSQINPCILIGGICQDASNASQFQNQNCTTNTLYTYIQQGEDSECMQCQNEMKIIFQLMIIFLFI